MKNKGTPKGRYRLPEVTNHQHLSQESVTMSLLVAVFLSSRHIIEDSIGTRENYIVTKGFLNGLVVNVYRLATHESVYDSCAWRSDASFFHIEARHGESRKKHFQW